MKSGSVEDRDLGWKEIRKRLSQMKGSYTKVGVQKGTMRDGEGTSMATVAAANELGVPGGPEAHTPGWKTPPRSFLGSTFEEERSRLIALSGKLRDAVILRRITIRQGLGALGEYFQGKVVAKIHSHPPPPNAPATIAAKGSSGTLVDSGQLAGSIHHVEHVRGETTR